MSSYFYGLVQQRGPWATTDVDILRNTQPRVTQSVVESRATPANPAMTGVLAGTAGYGGGAGYASNAAASSINGVSPSGWVPPSTPGKPWNVIPPEVIPKPNPVSPQIIAPGSIWGNPARDPLSINDEYAETRPSKPGNPIIVPPKPAPITQPTPGSYKKGDNLIWGNQGKDPLSSNSQYAQTGQFARGVPKSAENYTGMTQYPLIGPDGAPQYDKNGKQMYYWAKTGTQRKPTGPTWINESM
jgi:hypothetical protein